MDEADSFDMSAAQEELASELFPKEVIKDEHEEVVEDAEDVVEEEVFEETEESTEETTEVETKPAPQSWKKEMHETWNGLTKEAQEYIELREQQMKEGIDVAKEDYEYGRTLRETLSPYKQMLESQNVNEVDAVKYLLNAHYNLSNADEDGKIKLFNQMAQSYGIHLDGSKVAPEIQSLQQEIQNLRQIVGQTQQESQQEKQSKIEKEVAAFASEHEFFDDVADDIVPFINAGHTLSEAYEKAIWANPVTRQKEIDRLENEKAEALEKEKQEKIQKAKKAKSTNVRTQDTNKAPTGPKVKMFDDLSDVYDDIQSR